MSKKFLPLIRVTTPNESRVHMVDREKFVIGRSPEAEILLIATSISRKHLSVEIRDKNIFVEDLGSSNGSFLNDLKLEPGKKVPVPEKTAIRLGHSNEIVTIELIERPVEFDKYHSYLPKFNQDLQGVMDNMLKDAQAKADLLLKEAQSQADHYVSQAQAQGSSLIQKVRIQEDSSLEVASAKSTQILKEAENEAREIVEKARQEALAEAENIRSRARIESEEFSAKRLEQVREEAKKLNAQTVEEVRERALRDVQAETELSKNRLREQMLEIKIKAQMEADQILQNAHKEASKFKETGVQEFEKLRNEAQKKAQTLLDNAELEAEKILQHTREASEKMRQSARQDSDEILARGKSQSAEILRNAETQAQEIMDGAKKKAQTLIDHQEKESAQILSELGARIQAEAQKEAQRLIKQTEDQLEESKAQARKEVIASQAQKAQVEDQIAALTKDLTGAEKKRLDLQNEIQAMQSEVIRLKEENEKQSLLRAKLEGLEKQAKTLELQKIQIAEKSAQTAQELELLKKNTFEELERVRKAEERKITEVASIKAKEFSQRIERVIIADINKALGQKLNASQLSEISSRVNEELISLFASETFKHEEKKALKAVEAPGPSFFKSPVFRWGLAISAVVGVFFLAKNSKLILQKQNEFTENLVEQQKEEIRFKPDMTNEYRSTYTDNVLYMNHYLEIKNDPKLQDQWALNLNEFFLNDLKLSEENMVKFIGIESALIKRLSTLRDSVDARYMEEGINRMREAETEETAKVVQLLQGQANYDRLRTREKIFLSQISVKTGNPAQPATPAVAPEVKLGGPPAMPQPQPRPTPPTPVAQPTRVEPAPTPYGLVPLPGHGAPPRKPSSQKKEAPKKRPFPYR